MILTIARRFSFSASHKLADSNWSESKNYEVFGRSSQGDFGHGHNYKVEIGFQGPVNSDTGMMMELSQLKDCVEKNIIDSLDHKYLNQDVEFFQREIPTTANVAKYILLEARRLFEGEFIDPVFCCIKSSQEKSATAIWENDHILVSEQFTLEWGFVRELLPHINKDLHSKGVHHVLQSCPVIISLPCPDQADFEQYCQSKRFVANIEKWFADNSNSDLRNQIYFTDNPQTFETITMYVFKQLADIIPVESVEMIWNSERSTKVDSNIADKGFCCISEKDWFHSAHRLWKEDLSEEDNKILFGKCHQHHGHSFKVDVDFKGKVDPETGFILPKSITRAFLGNIIKDWQFISLNDETVAYKGLITTGETIIDMIYAKLLDECTSFEHIDIERIRLWETENNSFILKSCPKYI